MTAESTPLPEPERASPSFRPAPTLAVGVAGHHALDPASEAARRIGEAAERLFASLFAETRRVAAAATDLFAPAPPVLRVVSRLTGGTDLVLLEAADRAGAEIRAVLPWRSEAPSSADPTALRLDALLARIAQPLALDGEPGDPQARAQAGNALLDRSDLLVVAWDGRLDPSPGSTARLVQQAVERRIPVLLLPLTEESEVAIIDDPDALLLPAVAIDLPRVALADNLDRLVARAFAPPASEDEREALRECLAEPVGPKSRRPEYRALVTLAARWTGGSAGLSAAAEWTRARDTAGLVSPEAAASVARLALLQGRMEELAAFYGQRARSGIVLRYGMPAVGGLFIALLAVIAPQYSLAWLGVQGVVMTLLVSESTWATRRRWSERWLDYRSLAERLRCDRYLRPYGIDSRRIEDATGAEDPAWMRWCHRRLGRDDWTGGTITPAIVEAALRHLVEVEIPGQRGYHESAAFRYRSLGDRLRLVASGSAVIMLVASLALLVLPSGGGWVFAVLALITSLLIVLPSLFLAARGLRAEAGFELAASRSRQASDALGLLATRIGRVPPSLERLIQASLAAARAMIMDTVDWRVGLQRSRSPYRAPPPQVATTQAGASGHPD